MIQRRQFLGSIATVCAMSGTASRFLTATQLDETLNWPSRVIETLPFGPNKRCPVVTGISVQKTGDFLAIVGDNHFVSVFDLAKDKYVQHLSQHSDWVRVAKFSPDGRTLATAGNDRKLMCWNVSDWSSPVTTKRHPEAIINLAFSADGTRFATVGFESALRIYNSRSGSLEATLNCPCRDMHAVAFSKTGTMIAAGGRCGTVRVWNPKTGSQIAEYKAHRQRIRSVEFTQRDEILSCGDDQVVRVADPVQLANNRALPRHASKLYDVASLEDGMIATSGSDNLIHLWQINNKSLVGSLKGHTGTVTCLDQTENMLVSGSYDTHVRIWDMQQKANLNAKRFLPNQKNVGWNQKLK